MLLGSVSAFAADPSPFFQSINVEQGLSHRKVNCILRDKRGFLWFGTEDGLNRFDGRYFVVFKNRPNDKTTISGNIIKDLYEDSNGVLWIATEDGGLSRYDYRLLPAQQFKQYKHNIHDPFSIPENGINKITADRFGHLWLGTDASFTVRFDPKNERFNTPAKTGTRCVYALSVTAKDTLYVGRAGGGLLKINLRNNTFREDPKYKDLYAKQPHVTVTSIFTDGRGCLWLGSWDKLVYHYDPKTGSEQAFDPNKDMPGTPPDDVISFAEDQEHRIWMAGKTTGLKIYDPVSGRFFRYGHDPQATGTVADNHINSVYIDRNGIVWLATNNGVSFYNPLFSTFIQHPLPRGKADVTIYDFYKENNGALLIGTSSGIYYRKDSNAPIVYRKIVYRNQQLAVTKFFRDVDGTLYIGTNYTLFRYDEIKNQVSPLPHTEDDPVMCKLISSRIVSIQRDTLEGHPVLLTSPYGHFITYYDLLEQHWVSRADSVRRILKRYNIRDNLIRKIYKDKRNNLWLATFKEGLGKWRSGSGVSYFKNDVQNRYSLTCNDIYDVQEDYSGNLWVSTYGGGVNYLRLDKWKFSHLSESSNLTEGMQLDQEDNLWMLCNGHIHRYEPSTAIYSCYDVPRLQSSGGVSGYLYKDKEGVCYAAGLNYYVTFDPAKIAPIPHEPSIYFTDFRIGNQSYSDRLQDRVITLNYWQNIFTLEFSAPEYSGDNLQYAYMLEGVDHDWIFAGKKNTAEYTNLKGGTYRFKVRATNWKSSFGNNYTTLTIVVKPPFWQTTWFIVLMILCALTIVYLIYRYRINELLKQQAIRDGIAKDLHDQIGSTLSSISVYSEVAKIYASASKKKELSGVLDTISTTSNEMIGEMADIVWAINPQNDHLESLLQRISAYGKPLCSVKGINFLFKYDHALPTCNIGMKMRKNVFLIIKEAINNAVKHAQCSNLIIEVSLNDQFAELLIKDDGVGFSLSDECRNRVLSINGNGLLNIRSRARELGAKAEIVSEPGVGTLIKIIFPYNNKQINYINN